MCRENGLSVLEPEKGSKGKNYAVYKKEKTAKAKLKLAVDTLIPQVSDFEELLARLQAEGFTIKRGKYVSCLVLGQERFTRLKTLGADYTEEAIREGIEGKRTRAAKAPKTERSVSLLIDIENSIKAAQGVMSNGRKSRRYKQRANRRQAFPSSPISPRCNREYEKLPEQKEVLYTDYGRLKKQVKEYDVIKQNIDSILRQPREPEQQKGKERE